MSASLARLMAWLSPVFPTGGFAYSAGLERAARDDVVGDEASLQAWLTTLLARGSFWNEAVLTAAAYRGEDGVATLAAALAPTAERHRETLDQGAAFVDAVRAWGLNALSRDLPLPVALGKACRAASIPLEEALTASLQTQINNQLQAAIRLSLIGQSGAARIMATLEPHCVKVAGEAAASDLTALGGSAFLADMMSARHETQEPRLFMS